LLKWNNCIWNKTRPQTHTQKQSSLTKNQSKKTMFFSFFSWKATKKESSSLRKKQYNRKLTIERNTLKQCSSQTTKSKNLRPHFNVSNIKKEQKTFLFLAPSTPYGISSTLIPTALLADQSRW
jgi:hypothetical protein